MNEFLALVANNKLKKNKRRDSFRAARWWKIYAGVACIVALGGCCYGIYTGVIVPLPFLLRPSIDIVLVVLALITPMGLIKREWSGQTVSWWLTLPCPRSELLLAKLVGVYIRFLKVVAWSIAVLAAIAAAGILLNPSLWTAQAIGSMATAQARDYILIIAASPLLINYGLFLAVTGQSRLRPIIPMVWIFIILLLILFLSHRIMAALWSAPYLLISLVAADLIMSAIVFSIASYILTEQTEV